MISTLKTHTDRSSSCDSNTLREFPKKETYHTTILVIFIIGFGLVNAPNHLLITVTITWLQVSYRI